MRLAGAKGCRAVTVFAFSVDRVAYPPHGDHRLSNIAPPGGQVGGNLSPVNETRASMAFETGIGSAPFLRFDTGRWLMPELVPAHEVTTHGDIRVRSLIHELRSAAESGNIVRADDLETQLECYFTAHTNLPDPESREIWDAYSLSRSERRLAECLRRKFGSYVSRDAMMNAIYWDAETVPINSIIEVYACKLNKKLAESPYATESDHSGCRRMVTREARHAPGNAKIVAWRGIRMGPKMAGLAEFLFCQCGRWFTTDEIERTIGYKPANIPSLASYLRKKLKRSPYLIEAERGFGYRLVLAV